MKLYERMHPPIRVSNLYSRFNEKCAKSIEKFVNSLGACYFLNLSDFLAFFLYTYCIDLNLYG